MVTLLYNGCINRFEDIMMSRENKLKLAWLLQLAALIGLFSMVQVRLENGSVSPPMLVVGMISAVYLADAPHQWKTLFGKGKRK